MAQLNLVQGPIPRLLLSMALPASLGYLFTTLYNLTDTFWASHISQEAVAGLGISFPVFLLVLGVAIGLGQGTTVLTAHAMGSGDEAGSARIVVQAALLSLIASALLALVGGLVMPPLFGWLAPDTATAQASWDYFSIVLFGNIFFLLGFALNGALNALGDTVTYSLVSIGSTLLNFVLDPLLIFGLQIADVQVVPALGLVGVGWATITAQALGLCFILYRITKISIWPLMRREPLRLNMLTQRQILAQGVPATGNMMAVSLAFVTMLALIRPYGTAAAAGFAAGLRIEQLALLPAIGLNTAAISLVGQNFGAKRLNRVLESFRLALLYALIVLTTGGVLIYLLAPWLILPFAPTPEAAAKGVTYLRIIAWEYPALAIIALAGGFLQAMKYPNLALIITVFRLVLAPLLIWPFFATTLGLGFEGIWYGVLVTSYGFGSIALLATLWVIRRDLEAGITHLLGIARVKP